MQTSTKLILEKYSNSSQNIPSSQQKYNLEKNSGVQDENNGANNSVYIFGILCVTFTTQSLEFLPVFCVACTFRGHD